MAKAPPTAAAPQAARKSCSSSVVEHSLGKGEVESSILSCSTSSIRRKIVAFVIPWRGGERSRPGRSARRTRPPSRASEGRSFAANDLAGAPRVAQGDLVIRRQERAAHRKSLPKESTSKTRGASGPRICAAASRRGASTGFVAVCRRRRARERDHAIMRPRHRRSGTALAHRRCSRRRPSQDEGEALQAAARTSRRARLRYIRPPFPAAAAAFPQFRNS